MSALIQFKKLDDEAIEPELGSEDAACFDLFALEDVDFAPSEVKLVRTGWAVQAPEGMRTNLYVRSSTPLKKGFLLANGVGIIDADYRGELLVQLMNIKNAPGRTRSIDTISRVTAYPIENKIRKGDKIAQLEIVQTIPALDYKVVKKLSNTQRGEGGFGSTGD